MSFRTDVSITNERPQDARLRVVSAAPDSKEHAMLREFYRQADLANVDRDDYTPYNGWIPPQTHLSVENIRSIMSDI